MRKRNIIFLLLIFIILLFGCSTNQEPKVKTVTVHDKEFVYTSTKDVDPAYSLIYPYEPEITPAYASIFDGFKSFKSIFSDKKTFAFMTDYYTDPSIYELTTDGSNGYIDVDPTHIAYDFNTCGYLYFNNSYNNDSTVHEFDLSGVEYCNGIKSAVYIKITQVDADKSGITGYFAFRPHGSNYAWQTISVYSGVPTLTLQLTGDTGIIDWQQLCYEPYDKKSIYGEPTYHDYCRSKYTMEVEKILQ